MYYASFLGSRIRQVRHDDCSSMHCQQIEVVAAVQEPNHISDYCTCESLSFNTDFIADLWLSNMIPLVCYQPERECFELEAHELSQLGRYIAISHVWVDGLGNEAENSVPACQARAIQESVYEIQLQLGMDEVVPWFLDTLCIPTTVRGGHNRRTARKHAVSAMGSVYSASLAVLARDGDMMRRSADMDPLESLYRMHLSHWSFRMWTYQEASLARHLFFTFKDRVVDLNLVLKAIKSDLSIPFNLFHSLDATAPYPFDTLDLDSFDPIANHPKYVRVQEICVGCQLRSTTKPGDALICIALASGYSPAEIKHLAVEAEASEEQMHVQMVSFLKMVRVIRPGTILSTPCGVRIPGFRWIPYDLVTHLAYRTSLDSDGKKMVNRSQRNKLVVTDSGVVGRWCSVQFQVPKDFPTSHDLELKCAYGSFFVEERRRRHWVTRLSSYWGKTCAILYLHDEFTEGDRIWKALLVEVVGKDAQYWSARSIWPVRLQQERSARFTGTYIQINAEHHDNTGLPWCID